MSINTTKNINVLGWYTDLMYQNHKRSFAYNYIFPFVCELGKVPPFQLLGESIGEITEFKIIKVEDLSEYDGLSQLVLHGMAVQNYTDYDLIVYPGILSFSGVWESGRYFCMMSDGVSIWYSDIFTMVETVANCLKLVWWHNEAFNYSGGHIQYSHPFKYFAYIRSDIGKPDYKEIEEVVIRGGKEFPLRQTTWKELNCEFIAPEYFIDTLHRIRQHDNVEVFIHGFKLDLDKFDIIVNWQEVGNIAVVVATFRTDTYINISGRNYVEIAYEAEACGCLTDITVNAVAIISQSAPGYAGFYYLDGLTQVQLITGDLILKVDGLGRHLLEEFNGSGYVAYNPHGDYPSVCVLNVQEYFFENGGFYVQTHILSVVDNLNGTSTITGRTFPNVLVDVYVRDTFGIDTLDTTGTSTQFNGVGIIFTHGTSVGVFVKPRTINCSDFDNSNLYLLINNGIGWMTIETTNIIG